MAIHKGEVKTFLESLNILSNLTQYIWNAIRDQDGQMLMESGSRAEKWKGYFEKLLNGMMPFSQYYIPNMKKRSPT